MKARVSLLHSGHAKKRQETGFSKTRNRKSPQQKCRKDFVGGAAGLKKGELLFSALR
jgi:hypothetical protein